MFVTTRLIYMFVYLLVRRTEKIQSNHACSFVVGRAFCGIVWNPGIFFKMTVFLFTILNIIWRNTEIIGQIALKVRENLDSNTY